jgi:hypothetical protein
LAISKFNHPNFQKQLNDENNIGSCDMGVSNYNNSNIINSTILEQTNNLILYMNLSQTIQNLASNIGVCYENLKFNKNLIHLIMKLISVES